MNSDLRRGALLHDADHGRRKKPATVGASVGASHSKPTNQAAACDSMRTRRSRIPRRPSALNLAATGCGNLWHCLVDEPVIELLKDHKVSAAITT